MIAIPDFGPGAMENWGLITYKERYLLYERGVSSESSRQSTATVIAHELGHQVSFIQGWHKPRETGKNFGHGGNWENTKNFG